MGFSFSFSGIRWLRLLFGREFNLSDTLELWDALLADSCPPSLADQLVISLLMSVRELLLKYDYPDAVQLLMKLPSNLSVRHIVCFALHLKDPLRFPKPTGSPFHHGERRMPSGQMTGRYVHEKKISRVYLDTALSATFNLQIQESDCPISFASEARFRIQQKP